MENSGMKRIIYSILISGFVLTCLIFTGCTNPDSGASPGDDHKDTVAIPVFNISTGAYSTDQSITITCATAGADIHYTVDGSTKPGSSSPVYNSPISVASHGTVMTIRAIAMKSGMLDSSEASVTITINYNKVSTPQFDPVGGTYKTAQSVTITCATADVEIRYTTNNIDPSATNGTVYSGPVSISADCTLKAIAYKSGMADSTIASEDYRFTPAAPVISGVTPGIHKVTVAWGAVNGASSYNLYYAKGSTVDTATGTKVEVTTGTTAEIAFPNGGDTYAFIVTAVNTYGESVVSNTMTSAPDKGWFWTTKGNPRFSEYFTEGMSLAIDSNNVPYVAFIENIGGGKKATVMTYNGTNWVAVGGRGFTTSGAFRASLAIGSDNVPYLAYSDNRDWDGNGSLYTKATVVKFNGTSWVNVGAAGFSVKNTIINSLSFDLNNVPYVAYQDDNSGYKATIMKFNGTAWEYVGTPGFSSDQGAYISVVFDANNIPYTAYRDYGYGNKARVMKFNGTSWEDVGTTVISANKVTSVSLAFDAGNTLYAAFGNDTSSPIGKANVMKFDGTNWVTVGNADFSAKLAYYVTLHFNSKNTPYVSYYDVGNGYKSSVVTLNGTTSTWEYVGKAGFSDAIAEYLSFAIGSNDILNVAYIDYSLENGTPCLKATVKSYEYW
jgi:hypothetical protein